MSELKYAYTKVPDQLIIENLPSSVLRVMLHLLRWQNASTHFESYDTIAFHCGLNKSTVKRAIKYLKKCNYITVISRQKDCKSNIYKINFREIDSNCIISSALKENKELKLNKIKKEKELLTEIKTLTDRHPNDLENFVIKET